ncbi:MAG: hypothetical protein ACRDD8_06035 [Bacteroidales bacterium]
MDRYKLTTDKIINMITPFYLRGRNHILFLQSLVVPIQQINDSFAEYTKSKHVDAIMTSQVKWFEWYLNDRLSCYFKDDTSKISIDHNTSVGVPIYYTSEPNGKPSYVYQESDTIIAGYQPDVFYQSIERTIINSSSFTVVVPELTGITTDKFIPILTSLIERYRLAGKTYNIITK